IKHGYTGLFPVNRLDRLTSGLMLIGLNANVARNMEVDFRLHRIQKEYICKVKGDFPPEHIVCDQPIRVVAHKLSLNCVDPADGKPSTTEFQRLSGDGETSIVYCRPKTGRTHQIRVHLQFLGFPIANDPLYCNEDVWGQDLGKDGKSVDCVPRMCSKCSNPTYPDPTPDELSIWLHAWRYSGPGWTFETPLPAWAQGASDLVDSVKYHSEQ
ncbi:DRAP deaminase, partial [Coemansia sp. RSA 2399]